jgi:putative transposase
MRTVAKKGRKGKKQRIMEEVEILSPEEYDQMALDARVETIQALIPLGLRHIQEELNQEVEQLAGRRHEREAGGKVMVRYGHNPGSVPLGGQRIGIRVPRIRNQHTNQEVPLESYRAFHQQPGQSNESLLRRVLYGISCRNYEAAAEAIPGAIGLSSSTVSRQFIEASAKQLKEFQERDLSQLDLTALWLDGKAFAEDTLVIALGLTLGGQKVPLGFVQAGTENAKVLTDFLNALRDRGLRSDAGLLVILDGGKGLRAAVKRVFQGQSVVQRCQWHKRENVLKYLPKSEQGAMRRRLQSAYKKPTYREAKSALEAIVRELEERNLDAAGSLREGFEETLTLHRLGLFTRLGTSLKTTNCIESVMSQVETRCGKVSCWKNSSQKHRWLAATLLDVGPRLRRIRGYRNLPLLREALQEELGWIKSKSVA